ncbi:MAG: hypothetical protein ACK4S4_10265 [Pyrinomonadaceae bacterium]
MNRTRGERRQGAIARTSPNPSPDLTYYAVAALACCVLVAGFFLAARQHFNSMEFAHKNSRLRRQLDELQAEKRRLLLSRETASSPAEIRKAALKIKFVDTPPAAADRAVASSSGAGPAVQRIAVRAAETVRSGAAEPSRKVVPTALVQPVVRGARPDRQASLPAARPRRDRT